MLILLLVQQCLSGNNNNNNNIGQWYRKAAQVVSSLAILFPDRIQFVQNEFPTRDEFKEWLFEHRKVRLLF